MEEKLIHLIYSSTATNEFSSEELINLLIKSRQNNTKKHLTGMLLHDQGNFFQVLEGTQPTVENLFATIKSDPRHHNVTLIISEPIPHRFFGEWSMGFVDSSYEQLSQIEGLNDFFNDKKVLTQLDSGRARKLLQAFTQGYWRQAIK